MDRSPNGNFLALAGAESKPGSGTLAGGKLIIWNLANGQIHAEKNLPAPLTAIAFSPDSTTLAIGNTEGAVSLVVPDLTQRAATLVGSSWLDLLTSIRS